MVPAAVQIACAQKNRAGQEDSIGLESIPTGIHFEFPDVGIVSLPVHPHVPSFTPTVIHPKQIT